MESLVAGVVFLLAPSKGLVVDLELTTLAQLADMALYLLQEAALVLGHSQFGLLNPRGRIHKGMERVHQALLADVARQAQLAGRALYLLEEAALLGRVLALVRNGTALTHTNCHIGQTHLVCLSHYLLQALPLLPLYVRMLLLLPLLHATVHLVPL